MEAPHSDSHGMRCALRDLPQSKNKSMRNAPPPPPALGVDTKQDYKTKLVLVVCSFIFRRMLSLALPRFFHVCPGRNALQPTPKSRVYHVIPPTHFPSPPTSPARCTPNGSFFSGDTPPRPLIDRAPPGRGSVGKSGVRGWVDVRTALCLRSEGCGYGGKEGEWVLEVFLLGRGSLAGGREGGLRDGLDWAGLMEGLRVV